LISPGEEQFSLKVNIFTEFFHIKLLEKFCLGYYQRA